MDNLIKPETSRQPRGQRRRWFPPSEMETHCGRVLAGARVMAGLTQDELGRTAGLLGRTVRHWEASETPPSHFRTMTKLTMGLRAHAVAVGFNPVPHCKQLGSNMQNLVKDRRDSWRRYVELVMAG